MKKELNEKKWNRFHTVLNILFIFCVCVGADYLNGIWFKDYFWGELGIFVVLYTIADLLQKLVEGVVKNYDFLRKPFEETDNN